MFASVLNRDCFLVKGVIETIQYETKKQRVGFFGMLLGTLVAFLLRNILAGKEVMRAGEGAIRVEQDY